MEEVGTGTEPTEQRATAGADLCPRCGETLAALPPMDALALGGVPVRRCTRCGTRSTESALRQLVFSCEACGLPFSTAEILAHAAQLCPACRNGEPAAELPDPRVTAATEGEVSAALAQRWTFVTAPAIADYLERVTRSVARHVEGAPPDSRVVLVDDPALRTLALPSGTVLMSVGMLTFLEDEAELAFVLGHELAHAACGDAAVRLVRLGFGAVARGRETPAPTAWAGAALDLVRLGYGRKRERDADARALEAILALDYDPESALRFLRRLHGAVEAGAAAVAELAVAHPPALDRLRRLDRSLWGRIHEGRMFRVNRDVFRRAAGRDALVASLVRTELVAPRPTTSFRGHPAGATGAEEERPAFRAGLVLAAAVGLLLAGGAVYLLTR